MSFQHTDHDKCVNALPFATVGLESDQPTCMASSEEQLPVWTMLLYAQPQNELDLARKE